MMIWILLIICFCNITTGHGDQKSLLLVKDKSKSGNKIARRILEEIKYRNVSKQKTESLDKKREYITGAIREHEHSNNINISITRDPLPTTENEHTNDRIKQNLTDKKPQKQASTVIRATAAVIPVSPIVTENFESSTVSKETEKNVNNRNDTKFEEELVNVADNQKESDKSKTADSVIEHVPITDSAINVTLIPLQINNLDTEISATNQILRSSKNNTEIQKLSYLLAKLSQFKNVQFNPDILGHKKLTKHHAHNKNKTYLDSNKANDSLESDAATFSALKNQSQKPMTFNFCNNTVMLTFIKKLNINLQNASSFDGQRNLGSRVIVEKKHNLENSNKKEWKNLLTEISSLSNRESNVVTEHSSYEEYVPQSKNNYFRQSKKSEGIKDAVTPISVDYYFGRNSNEREFDSYKMEDSDEVVDSSEVESVSVVKNDYNSVNFDKDTNTFGRSQNKVTLSVLRDMINIDSKTLVEYPWYKSTLEVRSGILKIIDLINSYVYNRKIHPLDLELLKYLLYLHKSSSMKLQISENSPYSIPQLSINPMQVPILTNLFKNIKKGGSKSGLRSDRGDPQLTIMFDLQDLMNEILLLLESLHRKLQDLAKYNSNPTQIYHKLKDEYLEHAEDQRLRVVLLHISLARLFDYIDSSTDRVKEGFFNYVQQHPEEVKRDLDISMTILKVLHELRWK